MKVLLITSAYPSYLKHFYESRADENQLSYDQQKRNLEWDAGSNSAAWMQGLASHGYECTDIIYNAEPMQRAWWREQQGGKILKTTMPTLEDIAVAQAELYQPDILWFDDNSAPLLARIKSAIPALRLVLGWVGSAITSDIYRNVDIMLSCAPESVEFIRARGARCEHINHAFDPGILQRLPALPKLPTPKYGAIFIGQVLKMNQFHNERAALLENLIRTVDLTIFSTAAETTWRDETKAVLKLFGGEAHKLLSAAKIIKPGSKNKFFAKLADFTQVPRPFANHKILSHTRPSVFGLEMYGTLRASRAVLNIHADSSPRFASNMRLFETTGMGVPLLSDWRKNIGDFFIDGQEILTYKNSGECVEKIKWCLDNPGAARELALAGQRRTLREHNFQRRAELLDDLIRKNIRAAR